MDRDRRIIELLRRKGRGDVHAPAELLAIAAACLKAREPLPDALADYLASAFDEAASAPEAKNGGRIEDDRIARLAQALGMKRPANRPRANVPKGDLVMRIVTSPDETEGKLKRAVSDEYGVSASTARSRIKEAKAGIDEGKAHVRRMMDANGLDSLIPPRTPKND